MDPISKVGGVSEKVQLESEVMQCQIEANPTASYVWYEIEVNRSTFCFQYDETRQSQRIYQNTGTFAMHCQAQSNGTTLQQEFFINVQRETKIKMNFLFDRMNLRRFQNR